jgi:hypothetical protein
MSDAAARATTLGTDSSLGESALVANAGYWLGEYAFVQFFGSKPDPFPNAVCRETPLVYPAVNSASANTEVGAHIVD